MQSLPVIPNIPGLTQWRQTLNQTITSISNPKIPWNFTVSSKQGGNYLTWQAVNGADGYIVDISPNGDFTVGAGMSSVNLLGNQNTAYFASVPTSGGAAPPIQYYRVRATAGTPSEPQSRQGLPTAVISSSAIAPNDTVTASVTNRDTTTGDRDQAKTASGSYSHLVLTI